MKVFGVEKIVCGGVGNLEKKLKNYKRNLGRWRRYKMMNLLYMES